MNDVIEHFKDLGATIDGPHMWGTGKDCWVRIIYNGIIIGINTRGDGGYWINRGLDLLGICDYYILASHLYGETIDTILEQKESYGMKNIIFINKVGLYGRSVNGNENLVKEINDDNLKFKDQLLNIFYNLIYK